MSEQLALFGGRPTISALEFRQWPFFSSQVAATVRDKITAGDISASWPDNDIQLFEEQFVSKLCPGYSAIFCSNGTSGLLSAYFALGLDPGAEVLVPSNTFRATVTPLLFLNLRPVFCDSDPVSATIDTEDAERKITNRTQALVVTHIWGHPCDMDGAKRVAKKYGLALVEDCSHAHGAQYQGQTVGTFADVSVFSTGTKKMVSGGIGGILVTKDSRIFERALLFGQPKPVATIIKDEYLRSFLGSGLGMNLRGSPIAAILAREHLDRLEYTIATKNKNLFALENALAQYLPHLRAPVRQSAFNYGTWYAFNCRWQHPRIPASRLHEALKAEGVRVQRTAEYLHNEPIFSDQTLLQSNEKPRSQENRIRCEHTEQLLDSLIGWDTLEFYDPAENIIAQYAEAFEKISRNLDQLVEDVTVP